MLRCSLRHGRMGAGILEQVGGHLPNQYARCFAGGGKVGTGWYAARLGDGPGPRWASPLGLLLDHREPRLWASNASESIRAAAIPVPDLVCLLRAH